VAAEPFAEGEIVLLLDRAGNRRLVSLRVGARAHGHKGYLEHDQIIGQREGVTLRATGGKVYLAFRPRLADYALEMPRKTAIVYPKDVGIILVWADIYPGATVVESGLGSGSLTLALLRAVGPTGQVIVYEQRADLIPAALTNLRRYSEPGTVPDETVDPPNLIVHQQDIYEGIAETDVDRMVLDLPEPWRVLPHALDALHSGAMIACYSPSIIQVQRTVEALEVTRGFGQIESLEVLYRPWQVKGQAVRPVQQMVSHTAFLTFARRLAARGRRPWDGEADEPDAAEVDGLALMDELPAPGSNLDAEADAEPGIDISARHDDRMD
jgi:tRNA (adenine57-N1/adenine58-N1)-methyltransferase